MSNLLSELFQIFVVFSRSFLKSFIDTLIMKVEMEVSKWTGSKSASYKSRYTGKVP